MKKKKKKKHPIKNKLHHAVRCIRLFMPREHKDKKKELKKTGVDKDEI